MINELINDDSRINKTIYNSDDKSRSQRTKEIHCFINIVASMTSEFIFL